MTEPAKTEPKTAKVVHLTESSLSAMVSKVAQESISAAMQPITESLGELTKSIREALAPKSGEPAAVTESATPAGATTTATTATTAITETKPVNEQIAEAIDQKFTALVEELRRSGALPRRQGLVRPVTESGTEKPLHEMSIPELNEHAAKAFAGKL
jgi:tetrahydromethanopterin S-methyltransferase subunit B